MQVTRFQMHNVLKCYSKKLSSARRNEITGSGPSTKSAHETALPPETSRMAAMDKISQQVMDKVMDVVALSSAVQTKRHSMHANDEGAESAGEPPPVGLTLSVMNSPDRRHSTRWVMSDRGE